MANETKKVAKQRFSAKQIESLYEDGLITLEKRAIMYKERLKGASSRNSHIPEVRDMWALWDAFAETADYKAKETALPKGVTFGAYMKGVKAVAQDIPADIEITDEEDEATEAA